MHQMLREYLNCYYYGPTMRQGAGCNANEGEVKHVCVPAQRVCRLVYPTTDNTTQHNTACISETYYYNRGHISKNQHQKLREYSYVTLLCFYIHTPGHVRESVQTEGVLCPRLAQRATLVVVRRDRPEALVERDKARLFFVGVVVPHAILFLPGLKCQPCLRNGTGRISASIIVSASHSCMSALMHLCTRTSGGGVGSYSYRPLAPPTYSLSTAA